jgi:hypothetical protein
MPPSAPPIFPQLPPTKELGRRIRLFRTIVDLVLQPSITVMARNFSPHAKSFDLAYYHSAIRISHLPELDTKVAHPIIYTPHGIPSPSLSFAILQLSNIGQVTALLHGLHEVWNPWWLGGKLNLGAHNGLAGRQLNLGAHNGLVGRELNLGAHNSLAGRELNLGAQRSGWEGS